MNKLGKFVQYLLSHWPRCLFSSIVLVQLCRRLFLSVEDTYHKRMLLIEICHLNIGCV